MIPTPILLAEPSRPIAIGMSDGLQLWMALLMGLEVLRHEVQEGGKLFVRGPKCAPQALRVDHPT